MSAMPIHAGSLPRNGAAASPALSPVPWARALWIIWFILLALGSIGLYMRFTQGHLPAGYGSYVPWGLWIAIYFHAVGIAGGAFAVGALGYILNLRGLGTPSMLRTVIVLAIAAMAPAFMSVWLDLGHLDRAHRIMTSPSFTSMMAFNAWMYVAFVIVAAGAWVLSFRPGSTWLKPFLCLGIFFAVVIPSQSGAFFGVVDAREFWHSALFPVLFLCSAIVSGSAVLLAVRAALGPDAFAWATPDPHTEHQMALTYLRRVIIAGLFVYFILEFAEFSVTLWNPGSHNPAIELILTGPYWWVFWIVHLLLGGVVPLVMLLGCRSPRWWILAAVLVAVTFLATRLNVLVPGQAVSELKGLQEAFSHPRLSYTYHATAMEYLVGLFLVALGMASYFVLRRLGAMIAFRIARQERASS